MPGGARMRTADLLRSLDIFENLPAKELEQVAGALRERRLAEGEVAVRQGEPTDAMFIITSGRLRLSAVDPDGQERVLAHLTEGESVGELALLTGALPSATATAESESQLLALHRQEFDQLLSGHAPIMREVLKVVSQRTEQANRQLLAEEAESATAVGNGRVYALFSPRGGAGKTTLAVNLAVLLALRQPDRVALLDLDLTFGNAAPLLGLAPTTSLAAVPRESLDDLDRRTLGRYLVPHPSGLRVLAGGTRPEEGEVVTAAHVRAALEALKRQYTATVVDCGSVFSDPALAALELADKVLLVCTPELSTLRDLRECQRVFGEVVHLDKNKLSYAFNHHQPFTVLGRERFEKALEQPMALELPHAGEAALKAAQRGEPLAMASPHSPFVRAVERLAAELEPVEAKAPRGKAARASSPRPPLAKPSAAGKRRLWFRFRGT